MHRSAAVWKIVYPRMSGHSGFLLVNEDVCLEKSLMSATLSVQRNISAGGQHANTCLYLPLDQMEAKSKSPERTQIGQAASLTDAFTYRPPIQGFTLAMEDDLGSVT
jgi:hypothetical protein